MGVARTVLNSQEIPLLNGKQERATKILMMMSHALNVATVISFLLDFHLNRMMVFS